MTDARDEEAGGNSACLPRVGTCTEVRQYSEYGQFAVGDYVSRAGDDVQLVVEMDDDGYCATFRCVKAPASGWCSIGEDEHNLCSRYSRVDYTPAGGNK